MRTYILFIKIWRNRSKHSAQVDALVDSHGWPKIVNGNEWPLDHWDQKTDCCFS